MSSNIDRFLKTVSEIESNSWWKSNFSSSSPPFQGFTYTLDQTGERATAVNSESFESLLLKIRRLTMNNSVEQLHTVRSHLQKEKRHENSINLLRVWHSYWKLALIKNPMLLQVQNATIALTPYRIFHSFLNGEYFHSDSSDCNLILYGTVTSDPSRNPSLFLRNIFHNTVVAIGMAALGLKWWYESGNEQMVLTGNHHAITDFIWQRNSKDRLDQQYKIFSDWIEANGGGKHNRW